MEVESWIKKVNYPMANFADSINRSQTGDPSKITVVKAFELFVRLKYFYELKITPRPN